MGLTSPQSKTISGPIRFLKNIFLIDNCIKRERFSYFSFTLSARKKRSSILWVRPATKWYASALAFGNKRPYIQENNAFLFLSVYVVVHSCVDKLSSSCSRGALKPLDSLRPTLPTAETVVDFCAPSDGLYSTPLEVSFQQTVFHFFFLLLSLFLAPFPKACFRDFPLGILTKCALQQNCVFVIIRSILA